MEQQILTFVSNNRDHAAVWTFMEFTSNDPGPTHPDYTMQDREGQWWLCSRFLYNTKENALRSIEKHSYWDCIETVELLFERNGN